MWEFCCPWFENFWKNCDISLDIPYGLASVSDPSSASSGRCGPVSGSLPSESTRMIGPWTQHAGVAARLGSDPLLLPSSSFLCFFYKGRDFFLGAHIPGHHVVISPRVDKKLDSTDRYSSCPDHVGRPRRRSVEDERFTPSRLASQKNMSGYCHFLTEESEVHSQRFCYFFSEYVCLRGLV